MSTSLSGEEGTPLPSSPLVPLPRHPRILDGVLVYGERASIVRISVGYAHIEQDDDIRLTVPLERLAWVADRSVWVIVPESAA